MLMNEDSQVKKACVCVCVCWRHSTSQARAWPAYFLLWKTFFVNIVLLLVVEISLCDSQESQGRGEVH